MAPDVVRIAVVGTGTAGRAVVRLAAASPAIELTAGIVTDPGKAGEDLGTLAGIGRVGVEATRDLPAALRRTELVVYCGTAEPGPLTAHLETVLDAGRDLLTVAGPFHFARALGAGRARELDARARSSGSRVAGIGINPGFLLDALPASVASMVAAPRRILACRVAEIRAWGQGALARLGVGGPPEHASAPDGMDLGEPVALLGDALGRQIDRIVSDHRPYVAPTPRAADGLTVAPGRVAGFRSTASGYAASERVVELEWRGIFCLDPAVDGPADALRIEVQGARTATLRGSGDAFADAYEATAARALNAVPALRRMPPGLHGPHDLAVNGRWTADAT